jgi:hypothetical protein
MTTPVSTLDTAIVSIVKGDTKLKTVLAGKKIYSLLAPQGSLYPYIVIGSTSETKWGVFQGPGKTGSIQLHIWVWKSKKLAMIIYGHLERLLNAQHLTLDEHLLVRGEVDLMNVINDIKDPELVHVVVGYSYITKANPSE